MNRNLNRRIETAFPVLDEKIKKSIIEVLRIQLQDNVKACFIDEALQNVFKRNHETPVRAQEAIYEYIRTMNDEDC